MCGIQFCLSRSRDRPAVWDDLAKLNVKRGPDSQDIRQIQVDDTFMTFYSTVLHLRGRDNVAQPVCAPGWILCWNGEIFDGLAVEPEENDTWKLMEALSSNSESVVNIMSRIEGPFAFVLWNEEEKTLWFGRDCLGRRSLLWRQTEDAFMLSSVGLAESNVEWQEVRATGFYRIRFGQDIKEPAFTSCGYPVQLVPWVHDCKHDENSMPMPFPKINTSLPASLPDKFEDEMLALESEDPAVEAFEKVLDDAVRRRVADIPFLDAKHSIARVAILFSGGLDCICLAALAHRHLPTTEPIDLLNVAFDNPRSTAASGKQNKFDTPDRITGRDGVAELRRVAPERVWNFVEINVPFEEATEHRQEIIERMYPLDTVMDLSIAMALWFAARGKGEIEKDGKMEPYESHARVLLSGLGADEQLGGYSRHREAYRHGSWERLIQETQLDVDRIWTRNLGRDDRIISDHGKEARFPYLCTHVVKHLCQLPINVKMDMRYGRGVGEKLLLRQVARRLGLLQACRNWKRAIQFGAKTAKMTNNAEKGQHKLV